MEFFEYLTRQSKSDIQNFIGRSDFDSCEFCMGYQGRGGPCVGMSCGDGIQAYLNTNYKGQLWRRIKTLSARKLASSIIQGKVKNKCLFCDVPFESRVACRDSLCKMGLVAYFEKGE